MIRSMTGYGRSCQVVGGREITVEIRSVNHRFFECSIRVPRVYGYLEQRLKSFLQARAARGKIEVNVAVVAVDSADAQVCVNEALAAEYVEQLRRLGAKLQLTDDLSLSAISRFSDIFVVRKEVEDEEEIWSAVEQVAAQAADAFVQMRETEGEKLKQDILARLSEIEADTARVEEISPRTVEEYRSRLYQKLQAILEDRSVDEQRILTEAALFAEKIAVDEETVRLKSHITQLRGMLEDDAAVGRKLDFLVQELNRESNTIGSKAGDVEIARLVINMKSNIEKIREQIQNIE